MTDSRTTSGWSRTARLRMYGSRTLPSSCWTATMIPRTSTASGRARRIPSSIRPIPMNVASTRPTRIWPGKYRPSVSQAWSVASRSRTHWRSGSARSSVSRRREPAFRSKNSRTISSREPAMVRNAAVPADTACSASSPSNVAGNRASTTGISISLSRADTMTTSTSTPPMPMTGPCDSASLSEPRLERLLPVLALLAHVLPGPVCSRRPQQGPHRPCHRRGGRATRLIDPAASGHTEPSEAR